ncbi:cupin domain-containing protein [Anabaena cylindrica FACHB-243]|uniref:Cupin 2 conserved barrel domain protein n=1 Tax=Anabaena cylindrica (strain ATCC 27899 / PCC 7122) TaxID=272123 RepID=K9ZJB1_ANACC|nr:MULTISPECIES: cupin domain-containing protein [Anabaena]AFZ58430.1 Cupin 2 conserved barrel domain protein [Anabaena cylindrica PCC 7122]MBD2420560.1 cupin domain-containing protein [Anabaena cylindrica FACHB-243]MCM2410198.1 cupin domain-containing protein [Anabaena sp. CCAP 1446/1C]BAY04578.1 cupin domain-containing protein [Anabaena cylindrica PCC 7122]
MIINPDNVPCRTTSVYPDVFKSRIAGRVKQALGNSAGLKNFGVNLVTLAPGSCSALRHWHTQQDEFIYIIQGEITLVTNAGEQILIPGMMAAFPAKEADGHQLVNKSQEIAIYLEVGDRTPGDLVYYPDDDLIAKSSDNGGWIFTHRDGDLYKI